MRTRWAFEPKWDGFRAIVHNDGRRLRIMSRRGTDLAGRLPELAAVAGALPTGTTVDGELVVVDAEGRVDFDGMRRRGFGRASPGRLLYVAFDLLTLAGQDLIARRWDARRAMLVDLGLDGPGWCTTPSYPGEGATLFEATRTAGIEDVIAKRLDAPYRPGVRTKAWVRTKHFDREWFDVLGVAPTPGERYALLLGSRADGRTRYVGRGEWGFSRERLEELIARGRPTDETPSAAPSRRGSCSSSRGSWPRSAISPSANSATRHSSRWRSRRATVCSTPWRHVPSCPTAVIVWRHVVRRSSGTNIGAWNSSIDSPYRRSPRLPRAVVRERQSDLARMMTSASPRSHGRWEEAQIL